MTPTDPLLVLCKLREAVVDGGPIADMLAVVDLGIVSLRASLEERTRERDEARQLHADVWQYEHARAEAAERERDDAGNILIALNATLNGYPTSLQLSSSLVERVNDLQLQLRSAEATLKAAQVVVRRESADLSSQALFLRGEGYEAVAQNITNSILRLEAALTASPAAKKSRTRLPQRKGKGSSVSLKHEGYWLQPEVIKGWTSRRPRAAVAFSRSSVVHRVTGDERQLRETATRRGLTFRIFGVAFAVYVETQPHWFDLTPTATKLALAVPASPAAKEPQ